MVTESVGDNKVHCRAPGNKGEKLAIYAQRRDHALVSSAKTMPSALELSSHYQKPPVAVTISRVTVVVVVMKVLMV
jgi:hypothetical protein